MRQWLRVDASADVEGLSGSELRAVAAIWKRNRRELSVRFGGNSMRPTIVPGQDVLLRCTDDVAVGDVIVFVHTDQVAVHRLVAEGRGWVLTRGDAHTVPDLPILDREAIVGTIATVGPPPRSFGRSAALFIARAAGMFGERALRTAIAAMRFASRLR